MMDQPRAGEHQNSTLNFYRRQLGSGTSESSCNEERPMQEDEI